MVYTINPATEERINSYNLFNLKQLDKVIENSKRGFDKWKEITIRERAPSIKKIGNNLQKNKNKLAKIITEEMGKPIKESIYEIEKCSLLCDYYSKNIEKFLEEEEIKTEHKKSYIRFDPLGKILGIMPWNFPFWQVMRFSIPALSVGNSVILKHSSITLGCSLEIEKIFKEYLGKDIFQTVITHNNGIKYLMNKVDGVSLTGSVETGKRIGELAGKNIKKSVLELGGNDAFVIFGDADIKLSCENAIRGRMINSGQSCIAAKRFIVVKKKFDEFNETLVELVKKLNIGDPMKMSTDIGPLARKEFVLKLDKQVKESIKQGAKILYENKKVTRKGFYYQPKVLISSNKTPIIKEETFGPVVPIIKVNNDQEAVREANNSEFGLGASLWTKNIQNGMKYAEKINVGFVAINNIVKSDPRLPFGGIKNSGIGRELSKYGLLEFCNIKSVVVD